MPRLLLRPAPRPNAATGGRRLRRVLALAVALVALTPAVASALPIEDFAPYQPQTNCSPHAKPGTLELSTWLQKTYPGSGSLGISRSCKDGGVSEHKEGRAFDWAVNVHSARDRGYVKNFFSRIFATDSEGNADALARRMGIMYLIWNDHIYSSYYGFRARDYKPCKVMSKCSDTLRHRNHVHISLSRAGGAGLTSWYTGTTGTAAPANGARAPRTSRGVLDLTRTPYARLTVPVTGRRLVTAFKLRRGTTYKVTAAGLYGYGAPTDVADASCSWSTTTGSWRATPTAAVAAAHGSLNLLVNGARMSVSSCSDSHVYTKVIKPTRTAKLALRVANTAPGAAGTLAVTVSRRGTDVTKALPRYAALTGAPTVSDAQPGPHLISETVDVPASSPSVLTTGAVEQGATYRVTVSGTATLGGGVQSDGRCVGLAGVWWPQASLDRRFPDLTHARLYVDGQPFTGDQTSGATLCGTREHVADLTAVRTGRMELALWDPLKRTDDTGSLTVQVQRLTAPAAAAAAPSPSASTPTPTATATP
jgi:hypothetical protein